MSRCGIQVWGRDCGKPCFRGGEYCVDHTCGRNGCLNHRDLCGLHECIGKTRFSNRCFRVVFDKNTLYCIEHICLAIGCTNSKMLCSIHMCVRCKDSEKYPNYNYCRRCLTIEDVFKTLSTHEFYFGAMPKDIINMLIQILVYGS